MPFNGKGVMKTPNLPPRQQTQRGIKAVNERNNDKPVAELAYHNPYMTHWSNEVTIMSGCFSFCLVSYLLGIFSKTELL